jgi:hypothetical protein
MTVSPVGFFSSPAAPVTAVAPADRVKRRSKAEAKHAEQESSGLAAANAMHAAHYPEELASDSTQGALHNIRLGG